MTTFLSEHYSNSFCKTAWLQHYTSTLRITHEPNRQRPAVLRPAVSTYTGHLEAPMILEPLEKAGAISFMIICERLSVLVWCYLSQRWRRTYGGAVTRVYTPDKNSSAAVNMLRKSSSGIWSRWWRCHHWAEACLHSVGFLYPSSCAYMTCFLRNEKNVGFAKDFLCHVAKSKVLDHLCSQWLKE